MIFQTIMHVILILGIIACLFIFVANYILLFVDQDAFFETKCGYFFHAVVMILIVIAILLAMNL